MENRVKKIKTYIENDFTPNLDNVAFFTDSRIEILALIETGGQTATKKYYSEKFHENLFVEYSSRKLLFALSYYFFMKA